MKRIVLVLFALLAASVALAQSVTFKNTAADTPAARTILKGYQIADVDPGLSGTLAVGPLDTAGFHGVEAWIENLGSVTSGSCAAYAVRDGDDTGSNFVSYIGTSTDFVTYASTVGKTALGAGFTVAAGATSFAASVGNGSATGYNVMALPRRIFFFCHAATYARPRLTVQGH